MRTMNAVMLLALGLGGCAVDATTPEPSNPPPTVEEQSTALEHSAATSAPGNILDIASRVHTRLALPDDVLLPARVRCDDPIAGTWVSREHFENMGDWYRFELRVDRDGGERGALRGAIHARTWTGGERDSLPPACGDGFDWSVEMDATGTIDDANVRFGGRDVRVSPPRCGRPLATTEYLPDQFSGHLLEDGEHLVAFNNDGGRSENDLHVFRRVSCR